MPARTSIEWADYSSNPLKFKLRGKAQPINLCVPASPGCANCYAAAIQKRFHNVDYAKRVMDKAKPVLVEKELQHILNFKPKPPFKNGRDRPAVFIGDMTDLFGPWVPFDLLDKILAACMLRPDVDWLFLTKHPGRMREYFLMVQDDDKDLQRFVNAGADITDDYEGSAGALAQLDWPVPNVWLGTSAENQDQADKRVPELIATPAAVRFVSAEPLLDSVDLQAIPYQPATGSDDDDYSDCLGGILRNHERNAGLDWVIVGGESGAGARECDMTWIRSVVKQCGDAQVPVFVKQAGSKPYSWTCAAGANCTHPDCSKRPWRLKDPKGGDPTEWSPDLRVRQMPENTVRPSKIPQDSRAK